MQGKVTQPHEDSLLSLQLGNSTSLLALPVLAELARHLASVLIKVVNQFGGCYEKNSSEILMAVHNKALHNSSRLRLGQIISISYGLFSSVSLRFIERQLYISPDSALRKPFSTGEGR